MSDSGRDSFSDYRNLRRASRGFALVLDDRRHGLAQRGIADRLGVVVAHVLYQG